MKNVFIKKGYLFTFILALFIASLACTTFILKDKKAYLFGRNLDWHTGTGLLMINPANYEKEATVYENEKPAKWVSKYGSVTFNQIGRDLPFGGINEKGLLIENMTLNKTKYPPEDSRPVISACQWIQYQLDNCSTVDEVIETDKLIRIIDKQAFLHYLICDKKGNRAVIEFIDGKMDVIKGEELQFTACANSTYKESIDNHIKNGTNTNNRSLFNFSTAAANAEKFKSSSEKKDIEYAFKTLELVDQKNFTKWSIVYDLERMNIHFKIFESPSFSGNAPVFFKDRKDTKVKIFNISRIDFKTLKKARVFDLDTEMEGEINDYLSDYTTAVNKEFMTKAFESYERAGMNIKITPEQIKVLAEYPESFIYKK